MLYNSQQCKYHMNPCYKKFTRISASKTIDTKTILKRENQGPAIKSKLKRLTRSSSIKLLAGLPTVRRPRTDYSAEDFATPCKLHLSLSLQLDLMKYFRQLSQSYCLEIRTYMDQCV